MGKSLSSLPSTVGAPRSEFIEVHHSPPESFCISAYLRLKAGAGAGSEVGDLDLDLPLELDLMSVSLVVSWISDADGKKDSRSRGMGTEWKDAWSSKERARLQKLSCCAAGGDGRDRG